MSIPITEEQQEQLDNIEASFRFIYRPKVPEYICEISCKLTKRVVCEGVGISREKSLADALTKVTSDSKTKTPAEIAAENVQLRERLDKLQGGSIIRVEGKPTRKNSANQPPEVHNPGKTTDKIKATKLTHIPVKEQTAADN